MLDVGTRVLSLVQVILLNENTRSDETEDTFVGKTSIVIRYRSGYVYWGDYQGDYSPLLTSRKILCRLKS